ncbi:RNA polymerase sigma factor [Kitasatospora sp. MMS16-BH015]|uniref:sigma-70 family RNA polymerase sigma factor n=1 Tax=Kitasatospora sp. MMS16-BH015 TaxID=2018025 RepID=UPI000CA3705C|nr:sigma-70 family RNA polymerase sigma factor [Kitasatospora sp. MMS16-BH015]AUG77924.1 RNA polymerase sigma factor [Kitasatospora sp. MMS16-BH015]
MPPAIPTPRPATLASVRTAPGQSATTRTATTRTVTGRVRADDPTVTAWALAARSGDPAAVERFVRATRADVRRFVAHLSGEPQAADDLTQDTYLRALRSLPRFEGRSSARTWLLSIARRVVVDRYRFAAARPRLLDTEDWQGAAERAQPCALPGFEEGVALGELLDALPRERRDAFVLTALVGLPYEEVAELTGCPIGTVRSRVSRARGVLIRQLAAAEQADHPTVACAA